MPPTWWENLFRKMESEGIKTGQVVFSMNLSKTTYYRKRKQFRNGGVLPRKPGNGRKRKCLAQDYEVLFRDILKDLPPIAGHKRIWMEAKRRGAPFCQAVCYRMLKELNLLVPKATGRCRKKYEPLIVDGPNQIYVVDTTVWSVGRLKVNIYTALDAFSRWVPCLKAFPDRTAESTIKYYEEAFRENLPASVHTDNGKEFDNRNADGYLEIRQVIRRHGPSHTPQAQGLIERFNKTLKEECLMWEEAKDLVQLQACLDKFRDWYNRIRDHSSIGYRPPEVVHFARQ